MAFSLIAAVSAISLSALVTAPPAPAATTQAAVAKKTVPKKTVPKKTVPPKKSTPLKTVADSKKAAAKKAKSVDTSATRDASCNRLFKARADTLANAFIGTGTTEEMVKAGSLANAKMYDALSKEEQLPILSWAYWSAAGTFLSNYVPLTSENPKEQLDQVLTNFVESGVEGFSVLQAYAVSRCNFSMFIHDTGNLDAAPDAESAATWDAQIASARELAKQAFPPAPPASATWPRASLYK
jgi:hypothetical protein